MGDQKWSPFFFLANLADLAPPAKRTIFYIDGFNLYNGAVKGTAYKWLNIYEMCRRLRPNEDIVAVRYFTSMVLNPISAVRQATFLGALSTLPTVKTVMGTYTLKPVKCRVGPCVHVGDRTYRVPIEKRTDVSIGAHMVNDVARGRCDVVALVSGDSDLVPALRMIRAESPTVHVAVYVPRTAAAEVKKERRSDELRRAASRGDYLPTALFSQCQLPATVTDASGTAYSKPSQW